MNNMKLSNYPDNECGYKCGRMDDCLPLATSWVPAQQENPPVYNNNDALTRGTLFPGLDLPFKNIVNKSNPCAGTPLGEIMSLKFVVHELRLYLDTHKDDKEAFNALRDAIALEREAKKRYVKKFGPLTIEDLEYSERYDWLDGPWPWEYSERMGRN